MGRSDEANAEARKAHDLEPFSLTINSDLGRHLYYARQFEQALATHRKSLEMDQEFPRAHSELGYVMLQLKKPEEAVKEFQQALALDKDRLEALAGLGYAYAVSGQKKQALAGCRTVKRVSQATLRLALSLRRYQYRTRRAGAGARLFRKSGRRAFQLACVPEGRAAV